MENKDPKKILMSKTDMLKEEIETLSVAEQWSIVYSLSPSKSSIKNKSKSEVCFTGFGISKKEELELLAVENNFHIAKSVTKKLTYLVGGVNVGPKKLEKAEKVGATILTENEFIQLIKTGEIDCN